MARLSTGEAVVESLLQAGIETVFAVPGVHNDPFFDAMARAAPRIRVIHARHEQTAGYMALGAALATGRPAAFSVVPGPGLLNASAALLTAYGLGAPVLAIVGQIPQIAIDQGVGHLHELRDQLGLLRHFTKYAARITHPAEAPHLVAQALAEATSPPMRPVALECAIDVWPRVAEITAFPEARPRPLLPDPEAVAAAVRALASAQRPLIIAGGGALHAGPELRALADALGAPVMTYRRGRGLLPSEHPLAIPVPVAHRLWAATDVVLSVGARSLFPLAWWGTDRNLTVIRIEADAMQMEKPRPPDLPIVADAAAALAAIAGALSSTKRPPRADLAEARAWFAGEVAKLEPQMSLLRAIRNALPDDGILVEDVTQLGFVGRLAFPVSRPRLYLSAGYQDNLGWAYGAALGVAAALPGRSVVALAGDGGFLYQAAELATAVHHRLPVVALVIDDGAFGNVRRIQQEMFGNRLIACDLTNPDFVRFAESFGVTAFRASNAEELEQALRAALALSAPALVHVPVGPMPNPWRFIHLPRVRGFDESWRRQLP